MSSSRETEKSKIEAVKQVADQGHSVAEVAARLGVPVRRVLHWIKRYNKPTNRHQREDDLQAENRCKRPVIPS